MVLVIAALLLVLLADGSLDGQICRGEVALVGVEPVVEVCAPATSEPAVVLLVALLIGIPVTALLSPFVSEVSAGGLAFKLREYDTKINALLVRSAVISEAAKTASIGQHIPELREGPSGAASLEYAELRQLWAQLEPLVAEARRPALLSRASIRAWYQRFAFEIEALRGGLELADSAPDRLSKHDLAGLVDVARRVTDAAQTAIAS